MRHLLAVFTTVFLMLPAIAAAQQTCDGRDLRQTLTAEEHTLLATALEGVPYPEGNLWRAERDGQVIHLIGTMHLGDPRLDAPLERLRPIVESASRVLLEATPEEEAKLQADLTSRPELLLLQDTTLPELMPEDDWARLAKAAQDRGIPPFMASKFKPWYLSVLLAVPPCAMEQLAEKSGLDARIIDLAQAADVPLAALEPHDTVFAAFSEAPLEMQIEMMQAGLTDPQASEDQFATLLAGYFDEEHAASWELTRILSYRLTDDPKEEVDAAFDLIHESLLVRRNRSWIPVILDAVGPDPVVVAVGAAHFHGEQGVLNLLAQEGFSLARQAF